MFGLGHGHSLSLAASRPMSAPFVGALDAYTDSMQAAWSVSRRLLTSYTGNLIQVRRSGDDAVEAFGPVASGGLDATALLSWVIAGGGTTDGFIVNVYDQLGSKNIAQLTQSSQPKIVNSGVLLTQGGNPIIHSTVGSLSSIFSRSGAGYGLVASIWRNSPGTGGFARLAVIPSTTSVAALYDVVAGSGWTVYDNAFSAHTNSVTQQTVAVAYLGNVAHITKYRSNGTEITFADATDQAAGIFDIFSAGIGTDGRFSEAALYTTEPASLSSIEAIFAANIGP